MKHYMKTVADIKFIKLCKISEVIPTFANVNIKAILSFLELILTPNKWHKLFQKKGCAIGTNSAPS